MERKGGYCSVVMDEVQSLGQWGDSLRSRFVTRTPTLLCSGERLRDFSLDLFVL